MATEQQSNTDQLTRYFFDHSTTKEFIQFLTQRSEVYAPHHKGEKSYSYERVTDAAAVVLDYPRTIQPVKKYFLPPREKLLRFNMKTNDFEAADIETPERIFFAVHSYEMQGLFCLDYNFKSGNPESNYLARRENTRFIGISFTPDKYHLAKSVGIEIEKLDGLCLYFEPVSNGYLVFEVDHFGKELVDDFGKGALVDKQLDFEFGRKNFEDKIKYHYNRLPQVFEHSYHSKVWEEVAQKCLGCGTCNLLCPTCYCFDVRDEIHLDATHGDRERFWDSCMLNEFAAVAGGENFREKLDARTRHRLHRKFKYNTEQSGMIHCVGCGRCSRFCPAGINIVDIINALIDDVQNQQQKQVI